MTTVHIEDELEARVEAAAMEAGKTAHAFILEAVTERVEQAEEDAAFQRLADERWAEYQATGETVSWEEAKVWLQAHVRGEKPPWPKPRKVRA